VRAARTILSRLAQYAFTLLAASFLLFAVTEFSPGTVADRILGPYALDNQVALLNAQLGLEAPLLERYVDWLRRLAGLAPDLLPQAAPSLGLSDPRGDTYFGNFGYSLMMSAPVVDVVADRIGHTARLAGWALGLAVPISLLLGTLAGMSAGSALDRAISTVTVTLTSLPEFVVAVGLLLIFVATLGWLPGTSSLQPGDRWSEGAQLVLPVTVLVIASGAYMTRIVRASVAETMERDHVRTARLKGLSPARVVWAHVLRNAMIAPVTVILLQVNWILTGVVVVEAIFAYPGLGSLMLRAALFGDIFVVQALTMLALFIALVTQFVGDLAYVALDPRIRVA
jgi:peptide/nickel transport system permease protein